MAHLLAQVQAAGGFPHLAPDQQHTAEQDQHDSAEQQLHQALHQQLQYAAAQAEGNALQQAAPGIAYPTYRNKARRKATEKPVVRLFSLLPACVEETHIVWLKRSTYRNNARWYVGHT